MRFSVGVDRAATVGVVNDGVRGMTGASIAGVPWPTRESRSNFSIMICRTRAIIEDDHGDRRVAPSSRWYTPRSRRSRPSVKTQGGARWAGHGGKTVRVGYTPRATTTDGTGKCIRQGPDGARDRSSDAKRFRARAVARPDRGNGGDGGTMTAQRLCRNRTIQR